MDRTFIPIFECSSSNNDELTLFYRYLHFSFTKENKVLDSLLKELKRRERNFETYT